jgi:hypothetical protein
MSFILNSLFQSGTGYLNQVIVWTVQVLVQFDHKTFEERREFPFDFDSFRIFALLFTKQEKQMHMHA